MYWKGVKGTDRTLTYSRSEHFHL